MVRKVTFLAIVLQANPPAAKDLVGLNEVVVGALEAITIAEVAENVSSVVVKAILPGE